jgi:hypothetical protein
VRPIGPPEQRALPAQWLTQGNRKEEETNFVFMNFTIDSPSTVASVEYRQIHPSDGTGAAKTIVISGPGQRHCEVQTAEP